jgi:mandelate racemase
VSQPKDVKGRRLLVPPCCAFRGEAPKRSEPRLRLVQPAELYMLASKSLHFVGYQGLSMIAVSGLDMATHAAAFLVDSSAPVLLS